MSGRPRSDVGRFFGGVRRGFVATLQSAHNIGDRFTGGELSAAEQSVKDVARPLYEDIRPIREAFRPKRPIHNTQNARLR
jgi:hypothetical protein